MTPIYGEYWICRSYRKHSAFHLGTGSVHWAYSARLTDSGNSSACKRVKFFALQPVLALKVLCDSYELPADGTVVN